MSFILDALRKSEHERQRSTVPGLSQVPLATPAAQLPRWALLVIGVLAAAVLVLGAAWWQSSREPAAVATAALPMIERSVELPPPVATSPPRPPRPFVAEPAEQARGTALAAAADAGAVDEAAETPSFAEPDFAARATNPHPQRATSRHYRARQRSSPTAWSCRRCGSSCTHSPSSRATASSSSTAASTSRASASSKGHRSCRSNARAPCSSHAGHRFLLIAE